MSDEGDYLYRSADVDKDGNPVLKTVTWNEGPDILAFSGQTDPKCVISLENRLRYQNLSLNIMAVYYGGHHMRMRQVGRGAKHELPYSPSDVSYLNCWTPDNPDAIVPGYGMWGGSSTSTECQSLDIFVKSAEFIKIRNIVLAYELPHSLLPKIGAHRATLNFQIDNPRPLYLANGLGVDPETGRIRKQTSYIIGLNISF